MPPQNASTTRITKDFHSLGPFIPRLVDACIYQSRLSELCCLATSPLVPRGSSGPVCCWLCATPGILSLLRSTTGSLKNACNTQLHAHSTSLLTKSTTFPAPSSHDSALEPSLLVYLQLQQGIQICEVISHVHSTLTVSQMLLTPLSRFVCCV